MFRTAFLVLLLFTVLTGFIYPVVVTEIAQLLFPWQANGSLIKDNHNKIIGSVLIGQSFTDPNYFWGRPSATTPFPYNGASSSGSNMGPLNTSFLISIKDRIVNLKKFDPKNNQAIPVDLVTASGSGLDPEISPAAAFYQASRIATTRGIPEVEIRQLIQEHIQARTLGILGEPRVNVLLLNIALDQLRNTDGRTTPKP